MFPSSRQRRTSSLCTWYILWLKIPGIHVHPILVTCLSTTSLHPRPSSTAKLATYIHTINYELNNQFAGLIMELGYMYFVCFTGFLCHRTYFKWHCSHLLKAWLHKILPNENFQQVNIIWSLSISSTAFWSWC